MPNSHERAGVGKSRSPDKILHSTSSSSCLVAFVEAMALDARIAPNARIQVLHCFHEEGKVKDLYTPRTTFTRCFKL